MTEEKSSLEERKVLHLMGCADLSRHRLLCLLQQYDLNCVVDVRKAAEQDALNEAVLGQTLKEQGGYYLSFVKEFGELPKSSMHHNFQEEYEKALRSEAFQRGIARLRQGLERGFHIVLLDGVTDVADSYRLSLVAYHIKRLGMEVKTIVASEKPLRFVLLGDSVSLENCNLSDKVVADSRPIPSHNVMGRWGEDIAAEYLTSKGYSIVERNWHYRHREIDIIAYAPHAGVLCFVEVKTRRNDHFGDPEFAVNRQKMWFLTVAANHYLRSCNIYNDAQFDIIAITGTPKQGYKLVHIPDAIPPSARSTQR